MVFELRFMEGGVLIETWSKTDFVPQIHAVVTMKNGIRYKVKGVAIYRPPEESPFIKFRESCSHSSQRRVKFPKFPQAFINH